MQEQKNLQFCKVEIKNDPGITEYISQLNKKNTKKHAIPPTDLRLKLQQRRKKSASERFPKTIKTVVKKEPDDSSYYQDNYGLVTSHRNVSTTQNNYHPTLHIAKTIANSLTQIVTTAVSSNTTNKNTSSKQEVSSIEKVLTEDELLADSDALSVYSEMINEEDLLNDDDDDNASLQEEMVSSANPVASLPEKSSKEQSPDVYPTEKSFFEDDIFDTMSIVATENEFNDEPSVDKIPRKRSASEVYEDLSKDLPQGLPKSNFTVAERIQEWQKKQSFKIPKLDNERTTGNNNNTTIPVNRTVNRGILSTPPAPAPVRSSKLNDNEGKDLRNIIHQSKDKGMCFKYQRSGLCQNNNCKFAHSEPVRFKGPKLDSRHINNKPENRFKFDKRFQHNQNDRRLNSTQADNRFNNLKQEKQRMMTYIVPPGIAQSAVDQPPKPIISNRHSFPPSNFQTPASSPTVSQPSHSPPLYMNVNVPFPNNLPSFPNNRGLARLEALPKTSVSVTQNQKCDQRVVPSEQVRSSFQKPVDPPPRAMINQPILNLPAGMHFQISASTRNDQGVSHSSPPITQDFPNLSIDDLIELYKKSNDIETKWSIAQRLGDSSLGPNQRQSHMIILENLLLFIRDKSGPRPVEIACIILNIKDQTNTVKKEDLYILAELQSKAGNINKVIEILAEYKLKFGSICGINNDNEELIFHSIEHSGKIMPFWDDFKNTALKSDRVLDRMLCTLSEQKLTEMFKPEDVNIIYKKIMELSNVQLSPSARTTILFLLSTTDNITHMVKYIDKHADSILQVTQPVALKILELVPNLPNIIDCLPILRKLTKLVDSNVWLNEPAPSMWNQLLSYAHRKNLVQFSEQIYGIMEELKVKPSAECSMMMLSGLCKNRFFQVFERRCQDLQEIKIFPPDFTFPTIFAQQISEALQDYEGEDKNIVHHMIRFLISSDCPPTEQNITDVLDMLISKRRFSDVFALVQQCFNANIILSQRDLRRAVFALEEWMQNVEASITVYSKMRNLYPRPEHQCICGGDVKPTLLPIRQLSTGELASPKSSNGSNQGSSMEHVDSSKQSISHLLSRISAELNAFSKDISKFTDTYEQAYAKGYGNHEKILVGLFLGLTETDKTDAFQQFVVQLFSKFDEVPADIEKALGRVGLRLIKRFFERELWGEAVETIEVFHSYSIRYANATEGFGTQLQTKDDLTACEVADLCCRCCIYAKKPFTACAVFSHCDHCIVKEDLSSADHSLLKRLTSDLVSTLSSEYPDKTVNILLSTHRVLKNAELKIMVNKVLRNLISIKDAKPADIAKHIDALSVLFKHKTNYFEPKTTRDLVRFYVSYNQWGSAKHYFEDGRQNDVYVETFYDSQPFLAEIKTGMTPGEIYLTIESHLIRLINHPVYCIGQQLSKPVDLVVAPGSDLDGEQFQFTLQKTMRELGRVLAQEFAPPLQILGTNNQKYAVCPLSISNWFSRRNDGKSQSDNERFFNHKSNKRSVDIQGSSKNELKIKFCPTPVPSDQGSAMNSDGELSVVNASIGGEKRLLKSFPMTDNREYASRYIRKIVCTHLNHKYKKNGYFRDNDEFKATAKELSEAYLADMSNEKGYIHYNQDVHFNIMEYIDEYFNKQQNGRGEDDHSEITDFTDY